MKKELARLAGEKAEVGELEAQLGRTRKMAEEVSGKLARFLAERRRIDDMEGDFKKVVALSRDVDLKLEGLAQASDALQQVQAKVRQFEELGRTVEGGFERLEKKRDVLAATAEGVDRSFQRLETFEKSLTAAGRDLEALALRAQSLKGDLETLAGSKQAADSAMEIAGKLDSLTGDLERRLEQAQASREWLARDGDPLRGDHAAGGGTGAPAREHREVRDEARQGRARLRTPGQARHGDQAVPPGLVGARDLAPALPLARRGRAHPRARAAQGVTRRVRSSSVVVIARVSSYDRPAVARAVRRLLELLGAPARMHVPVLAPGASVNGGPAAAGTGPVLLKPNLLAPGRTRGGRHHASGGVRRDGARPAGAGARSRLRRLARFGHRSPRRPAAAGSRPRRTAWASRSRTSSAAPTCTGPGPRCTGQFHVADAVIGARALVNLPKLKTHALTTLTGALKNTFGVIPGFRKGEYHVTHPDLDGFSRMLADLNGLVRPSLVVMDAVQAMEGNGPRGGTLVPLGLLIVSDDPVAVDAVACRVAGIDADRVPVLRMAEEAGIGCASAGRIDLRGDPVEGVSVRRFALPPVHVARKLPAGMFRAAKNLVVPKPSIVASRCRALRRVREGMPGPPEGALAGAGRRAPLRVP